MHIYASVVSEYIKVPSRGPRLYSEPKVRGHLVLLPLDLTKPSFLCTVLHSEMSITCSGLVIN